MSRSHFSVGLPEAIDDGDYQFIRTLVREHTAVALDDSKVYLINARLLPVARNAGFDSVGALLRHLRSSSFGSLHARCIESIMTTETSFFRDHFPFDALRRTIIPTIIEQRRDIDRSLVFWSAGCSSGQEPYSLAMLIREGFPELASWNLKIFASDVSDAMIERSRTAVYSQNEVNRGLPAPMLVRYFTQDGAAWRLNPEIRDMVSFFRHNLAREGAPLPPVDVLLMRNVLIYFDLDTKRRVLDRVRRQLRAGGVLMLGTAETTLNLDERFERQRMGRAVVYRNGRAEVP